MDSSDFLKKQEEDKDIKLFKEEHPDVYKFIVRLIDGQCDDKEIENFTDEYGEEVYDYIKKIVDGELDREDIEIFKENYGEDIYIAIKKIIEKETSLSKAKPQITPYKKGDFIGQKYEVFGVLGEGGFGIVYLVYSHSTENIYALKTFRDEYLEDAQTRERFKKEAQIWIDLERHPYLVRAHFVDEISGRLFIAMEFIAPDEQGLNSLDAYLKRRPPDLAQTLRWAIQFCHGMEYAYSRGIKAHRDIKPANILIGQDKTVKISDFGLAGVIGSSKAISGVKLNIQKGKIGFSCQTMEGVGFGTPTHMPPEQFTNAVGCDERSDIYSFGIVLYQMAKGGELPFFASLPRDDSYEESRRFWVEMYKLHGQAAVPKLNSLLSPVIQRCLEKEPKRRYQTFKELRINLEMLLKKQTGEVVKVPGLKELETWEFINKGICYGMLGKNDEAIKCFEIAKSAATKKDVKNARGECHYQFAHVFLRKLFFDKPQWLTSMLASEKNIFLLYLWEKTAELLGEDKISSEGLSCGSIKMKGDITITVVQFPKPLDAGEAYYAALVYHPPKGFPYKQKAITRYITLERSFMENTFLCEWMGTEGGRLDHKEIYSTTPESFIEEVKKLIDGK
jgi:serine/threonine protein kinase